MSDIVIQAAKRTITGKQAAKKIRRSGRIPGIFFDKGQSIPVEIDSKYIPKVYAQAERQFKMDLEGASRTVKIADVQIDPIRRVAIHVDLKGL